MLKKSFGVIIALVLCFSLTVCSLPVYAVEDGFVYIKVLSVENDIKSIDEEIVYNNAGKIFVSVGFLTKYMPYYYLSEKNAFIRFNHDSSSIFGKVTIDANAKKAILQQNVFSKKEYALDNIFTFGNQMYLPLAQMAALLKSEIFVETDDNGEKFIAIGCCMNSLCDAEYAFSKVSNREYIHYSYVEMLDDIFVGSESLFIASTITGYCSSTIFDLQISNLDFVFKSGDKKAYSNILSACILDNKEYIGKISDTESLLYRFNDTMNLNSSVKSASSSLGEWLNYQKEILEPYKDLSMDNASLYIDVKDWGALFSTISTVCEWGDYALKFGSMNEDHKKMFNNYMKYADKHFKSGDAFYTAAKNTDERFGKDFATGAVNELLKQIYEKAFKKGVKELAKAAFAEVEIAALAIKAISLTCKLLGFDLTDNSGYNIMLNFGATSNFSNYYRSLPDNHFTDSNITEKYRLASVLLLLSVNQMFKQANKLNNKVSKVDTYYNDKIDVISNVLGMFYLSAQGKDFDNFKSIDTLISQNDSAVNRSGVNISDHPASQEEAEKQESKRSNSNNNNNTEYDNSKENNVIFGNWEAAAKDLLCNLPNYTDLINLSNDYNEIEMLDMTNDGIPEVLFYCRSGGGGGMAMCAYAYYTGQKYIIKLCEDDNSACNYIYPYSDTKTGNTAYISGMFDIDAFDENIDEGSYGSGYFWRNKWSQDFWKFNNGSLVLLKSNSVSSQIDGFDALYNHGSDTYSEEDSIEALKKVKEYNDEMHKRYQNSNVKYCCSGYSCGFLYDDDENNVAQYKRIITPSYANTFISKYKNGSHEYYPN